MFFFLHRRVSLVNSAIVAYFIEDLQINRHFDLFKKLLFMEDGEFSLSLSNQLFEKVTPLSLTQYFSSITQGPRTSHSRIQSSRTVVQR